MADDCAFPARGVPGRPVGDPSRIAEAGPAEQTRAVPLGLAIVLILLAGVILVEWLALYFLYKKNVFLRV